MVGCRLALPWLAVQGVDGICSAYLPSVQLRRDADRAALDSCDLQDQRGYGWNRRTSRGNLDECLVVVGSWLLVAHP